MSIDIGSEKLYTFGEITRLDILPGRRLGKHLSVSTLHRWTNSGIKGFRLEAILIGGTRYTSVEAVQRFSDSLTDARAAQRQSISCSTLHQLPVSRRKAIEAAKNKLTAAGISVVDKPATLQMYESKLHPKSTSIGPHKTDNGTLSRKQEEKKIEEQPMQILKAEAIENPCTRGSDTVKRAGGRPRKWDRLWEIIKTEDAKPEKEKDQRIANIYNQKNSRGPKATAKTVADVRYRYSRHEQNSE